jgi:hypothetical protein
MLPLQIMKPIRKRSASKQRGVDSEDGAESGSGRGLDPDVNQTKITSEEETWLLDITARLFPDAPAGVAQLAVPCFATPVPTEKNHRKCLTLEVAVQSAQAVIGHGHTIQTATQPPADVLDCEASARASSGPSARHLSLPDEEEIDDMRWLDPFLSPSMSDDAQHFRGHAEWPSMAGPGSTLNDELEDMPMLTTLHAPGPWLPEATSALQLQLVRPASSDSPPACAPGALVRSPPVHCLQLSATCIRCCLTAQGAYIYKSRARFARPDVGREGMG